VADTTIRSIDFQNFKALRAFHVGLEHLNILVGPNNAGKSTIIDALRLLSAGLRTARSRSPRRVRDYDGVERYGYDVSFDLLGVSTVNVHTDYEDEPAVASFTLSNGNKLRLYFPPGEETCLLVADARDRPTYSAAEFKRQFPIAIGVVPVLGPLEPPEELISRDTVIRSIATRRASRHFRNYWETVAPDDFEAFRQLLQQTWPGMDVSRPERQVGDLEMRLAMFCAEDRMDREVYWAGFGFQVWCQLLTHLIRVDSMSLIAIDEAELYLHPDLQRQLVSLLRDLGPDIVLATHSTEIVAEADPDEVVLIDKQRKGAKRITSAEGVRAAFSVLGSNRNSVISQLARTYRILLVEGEDFKILRLFAKKLGFARLATSFDFAVTELGGFRSPQHLKVLSHSVDLVLGGPASYAVILDRDYRPVTEAAEIESDLGWMEYAHVYRRKEIENYLLVPAAIGEAIRRAEAERVRRLNVPSRAIPDVTELMTTVTEEFRVDVESQVVSAEVDYGLQKKRGTDRTTLTRVALTSFASRWNDLDQRLDWVPGKEVLARLNEVLQPLVGINVTPTRIVGAIAVDDIPREIRSLVKELDAFSRGGRPVEADPTTRHGL
jgi:energy-coupling factor transporter ATP-binding protein EcfA2